MVEKGLDLILYVVCGYCKRQMDLNLTLVSTFILLGVPMHVIHRVWGEVDSPMVVQMMAFHNAQLI